MYSEENLRLVPAEVCSCPYQLQMEPTILS